MIEAVLTSPDFGECKCRQWGYKACSPNKKVIEKLEAVEGSSVKIAGVSLYL